MKPDHGVCGICLIRIEVQERDLLLTVFTNPDMSVEQPRAQHFTTIDAAFSAVQEFLSSFSRP
jgi:hypothetical protein